MITTDTTEVERLENDLKRLASKALPFATRSTLNSAAFATQKASRETVEKTLTTRNAFTKQSIRVDRAKGLRIATQEAETGSIAPYMRTQELGGVKTRTGKEGVAIATSYSSGEGDNAQPRQRLPRKPNRMQNINLKNRRRRAKNRKQATLFKVQDAVTSGRRFIFLDLGKRQGIFRVLGGRKRFKRGWPKGARLKMVHDMTRSSVVIPDRPWLMPAASETARQLPQMYAEALRFQLARQNIFRGA